MIRYMICPIIGAGTEASPYRASVNDVANVNSASIIPTHTSGPNIGKPKFLFAFCVAATPSPSSLSAVTNAYVFPDYNLDGRMDGMESGARTALQQSVEAYDLDGAGLHFDAAHLDGDSYRDVINALVQQIEPAFNVNNINVAEVAG